MYEHGLYIKTLSTRQRNTESAPDLYLICYINIQYIIPYALDSVKTDIVDSSKSSSKIYNRF